MCAPGIEFVATQLKSMVLTLGLIDLHLTVERAVLLSRLEEEYQVRGASCGRGAFTGSQSLWRLKQGSMRAWGSARPSHTSPAAPPCQVGVALELGHPPAAVWDPVPAGAGCVRKLRGR